MRKEYSVRSLFAMEKCVKFSMRMISFFRAFRQEVIPEILIRLSFCSFLTDLKFLIKFLSNSGEKTIFSRCISSRPKLFVAIYKGPSTKQQIATKKILKKKFGKKKVVPNLIFCIRSSPNKPCTKILMLRILLLF